MAGMAAGIYFILAPDHHGAVQLSQALNNHPDILSLGQGNPSRSVDEICSCGEKVSQCLFWTKMNIAIESDESVDDNRERPFPNLLPQVPIFTANTLVNNALVSFLTIAANEMGVKTWRIATESAERYFGFHDRFLSAAQEWAPHKVFVDGENALLKFMAMASMGFPVKGVIHIARDPRSYIVARRAEGQEGSPEKLALDWLNRHNRIRKVKGFFTGVPFLSVRYEDIFAEGANPQEKIIKFMGLEGNSTISANSDANKRHLVGVQGANGAINRADWRGILTEKEQESVIRTAEPLFSEFGYKS